MEVFAPLRSRRCTAITWPSMAAKWRGVFPSFIRKYTIIIIVFFKYQIPCRLVYRATYLCFNLTVTLAYYILLINGCFFIQQHLKGFQVRILCCKVQCCLSSLNLNYYMIQEWVHTSQEIRLSKCRNNSQMCLTIFAGFIHHSQSASSFWSLHGHECMWLHSIPREFWQSYCHPWRQQT